MIEKILKSIAAVLLVFIVSVLFIYFFSYVLDKQEYSDCLKWQAEAKVYRGYPLSGGTVR